MNWANRVTIVRLILIPIVGVFMTMPLYLNHNGWYLDSTFKIGNYHLTWEYLVAGILFVIASFTDMLDGYIARKYNQVTTFGKFFDSIADKLLTNTVLIIFACLKILPIWIVVLLICRDFIIDVVRQILASSNVVMAANNLGRYRAAVEMLALTIMFFVGFANFNGKAFGTGKFDEFGWVNQVVMIPMYIASFLSIVAALNYMILNRKLLFAGAKKNKVVELDEKK